MDAEELFRAFSSHDVWQVVLVHPFEYRHFILLSEFRPIVLDSYPFGHLTKKTHKVAVIYYCTARFSPSLQAKHPCSWLFNSYYYGLLGTCTCQIMLMPSILPKRGMPDGIPPFTDIVYFPINLPYWN